MEHLPSEIVDWLVGVYKPANQWIKFPVLFISKPSIPKPGSLARASELSHSYWEFGPCLQINDEPLRAYEGCLADHRGEGATSWFSRKSKNVPCSLGFWWYHDHLSCRSCEENKKAIKSNSDAPKVRSISLDGGIWHILLTHTHTRPFSAPHPLPRALDHSALLSCTISSGQPTSWSQIRMGCLLARQVVQFAFVSYPGRLP